MALMDMARGLRDVRAGHHGRLAAMPSQSARARDRAADVRGGRGAPRQEGRTGAMGAGRGRRGRGGCAQKCCGRAASRRRLGGVVCGMGWAGGGVMASTRHGEQRESARLGGDAGRGRCLGRARRVKGRAMLGVAGLGRRQWKTLERQGRSSLSRRPVHARRLQAGPNATAGEGSRRGGGGQRGGGHRRRAESAMDAERLRGRP
ncbi:hypothetical protein K505DRAFT_85616 [Melanomma pulvis-pyrius CBS 109.77]|uniref:Uncharacterized protein n=1 Tax=Melanomma pulvis-pyrius CBS 109.77 TaxID=1314802 RepID=A0A6A6X1M0_9PLEO|nr:hypothetical protein K505DRAFT_85616 [Melanomma pulvis-pyrius CBS 109.77]